MKNNKDENNDENVTFYITNQYYILIVLIMIGIALLIGILGYHIYGGLDWIDALLDASMILGGMGPVANIPSYSGKLFASFYALFSGLVFIIVIGIIINVILRTKPNII